jgi:hypothetical protein
MRAAEGGGKRPEDYPSFSGSSLEFGCGVIPSAVPKYGLSNLP